MLRCSKGRPARLVRPSGQQHVTAHAHGEADQRPSAAGLQTAATRRPADNSTATLGMSRGASQPGAGPVEGGDAGGAGRGISSTY